MISGVCFDMDGVLLDTESLSFPMMRKAIAMQGETLTEAQWQTLLGVNLAHTCASLNTWYQGRVQPDQFFRDWVDVTFDYVHEHGIPKKPGADDILRLLRQQGKKIALCTSNNVQVVEEYLRLASWEGAFDAVITGDQVKQGKPAPDIYLKGAEALGLSPAMCMAVEDSVNGVKSAKAAGMLTVMIPDMLPYTDVLAPFVDHKLDSLMALETLL